MRIGDAGSNYSRWYGSSGQKGAQVEQESPFASSGSAISRSGFGPATTPASIASGLWYLQGQSLLGESGDAAKVKSQNQSLADEFRELAHKSLAERIRDQYLKSLGLTEEDLAAMPADERQAIEDQIAKQIREQSERAAHDEDKETGIEL